MENEEAVEKEEAFEEHRERSRRRKAGGEREPTFHRMHGVADCLHKTSEVNVGRYADRQIEKCRHLCLPRKKRENVGSDVNLSRKVIKVIPK